MNGAWGMASHSLVLLGQLELLPEFLLEEGVWVRDRDRARARVRTLTLTLTLTPTLILILEEGEARLRVRVRVRVSTTNPNPNPNPNPSPNLTLTWKKARRDLSERARKEACANTTPPQRSATWC